MRTLAYFSVFVAGWLAVCVAKAAEPAPSTSLKTCEGLLLDDAVIAGKLNVKELSLSSVGREIIDELEGSDQVKNPLEGPEGVLFCFTMAGQWVAVVPLEHDTGGIIKALFASGEKNFREMLTAELQRYDLGVDAAGALDDLEYSHSTYRGTGVVTLRDDSKDYIMHSALVGNDILLVASGLDVVHQAIDEQRARRISPPSGQLKQLLSSPERHHDGWIVALFPTPARGGNLLDLLRKAPPPATDGVPPRKQQAGALGQALQDQFRKALEQQRRPQGNREQGPGKQPDIGQLQQTLDAILAETLQQQREKKPGPAAPGKPDTDPLESALKLLQGFGEGLPGQRPDRQPADRQPPSDGNAALRLAMSGVGMLVRECSMAVDGHATLDYRLSVRFTSPEAAQIVMNRLKQQLEQRRRDAPPEDPVWLFTPELRGDRLSLIVSLTAKQVIEIAKEELKNIDQPRFK